VEVGEEEEEGEEDEEETPAKQLPRTLLFSPVNPTHEQTTEQRPRRAVLSPPINLLGPQPLLK
jgi:hypothetical protein